MSFIPVFHSHTLLPSFVPVLDKVVGVVSANYGCGLYSAGEVC